MIPPDKRRIRKLTQLRTKSVLGTLPLHVGVRLNFEMDFAVAGAVELAEDDGLPAAGHESPALDLSPRAR